MDAILDESPWTGKGFAMISRFQESERVRIQKQNPDRDSKLKEKDMFGNYLEILWRSLRTFFHPFCESAPASRLST
jgi:hypothetical protein